MAQTPWIPAKLDQLKAAIDERRKRYGGLFANHLADVISEADGYLVAIAKATEKIKAAGRKEDAR